MITMEVDYEENSLEDKNPTFGDIEEIEDIVDKKFRNFKNFTVLQSLPNDHRFLSRRSFNRIDPEKIKLEWDGMKKNLPSSIYVRTYKSRIDLMRAAITGIEGTPFCHGLFFFDIYIPHNYPTSPPEISYRGILGFNPDGKISLRSWIPGNFGLLQVLVSIQDRILNDRPCYLLSDSQYLKSKNEVFLLSCEGMIWTLRCPLMDFQDFISGYFRKRAHTILLIYKNQIGKDKLFFNLVRAFEANGAYCQHHYTKEELKEKDEEMGEEKDQSTLKIANKIIKSLACLLDQ